METPKVGLLTLSNPAHERAVQFFVNDLENAGIEVEVSESIFENTTPSQRAEIWNDMIASNKFDYIIDVSGGDLASLTLPFLNFELYAKSRTTFCGYSDLTCVLNALYQSSGKPCLLFQPCGHHPFEQVENWLLYQNGKELFTWECQPLIPGTLNGLVLGGNVRCLLKTAGTFYFPNVDGKVLFLESNSGSINRIAAYFGQLSQMGIFDRIQGIMLGQFTQLDDAYGYGESSKILVDLLKETTLQEWNLPVWRTPEIGHSSDSKALWIGKNLRIKE